MIQATLLSDDPDAAASLSLIQLNLADPVATGVVAEIEPKRQVPTAVPVDFSIYVKATLSSQNPGVDRLRVIAPSATPLP